MDGLELLARIKEIRPADDGHPDDRLRHGEDRGQGHEDGRRGLPGQAHRRGGAGGRPARRRWRRSACWRRPRLLRERVHRQVPLREPGGREPGDAGRLQDHPQVAPVQRLRAAPRARAAPARSCSPRPCTRTARAATSRSSRWPAPPCPRPCWRASCSATRRARSPAPSTRAPAASRWPTAARCSWTRSATSRPPCRSSCCASWRSASSSAWAATARSRWTCASWPPPTATCSKKIAGGHASARTSTTGSTSSRSTSRRCASGRADIPLLAHHFLAALRGRQRQGRARHLRRGAGPAAAATPGRATCASWRTRSSGRWCCPTSPC